MKIERNNLEAGEKPLVDISLDTPTELGCLTGNGVNGDWNILGNILKDGVKGILSYWKRIEKKIKSMLLGILAIVHINFQG